MFYLRFYSSVPEVASSVHESSGRFQSPDQHVYGHQAATQAEMCPDLRKRCNPYIVSRPMPSGAEDPGGRGSPTPCPGSPLTEESPDEEPALGGERISAGRAGPPPVS